MQNRQKGDWNIRVNNNENVNVGLSKLNCEIEKKKKIKNWIDVSRV